MVSGRHSSNKSLHPGYCLYPLNWENLDLDEVKGLCPESKPQKPPAPLEPEINAKTLSFNCNAEDREVNRLSLIAASKAKAKVTSDVSSANNFFRSLMGGDDKPDAPLTAKGPLVSLTKHTCTYLMAYDQGSNPAALASNWASLSSLMLRCEVPPLLCLVCLSLLLRSLLECLSSR